VHYITVPVLDKCLLFIMVESLVHCCVQVRKSKLSSSVPSVEVSCDNANGYSSADAGNSGNDGSDVRMSPLFSSPSTVDEDDDIVERDNFIENIVSMLTPDVIGGQVQAVSTKTMADKATETNIAWNLDDIDAVLQETESYSLTEAVNTKTTADKATETNILWDLDDIDDLFQAMDSYSEPAAASSCEVSMSESSTLPVHNSTLDSTQLPAVPHNRQKNEVSMSESSTLPVHNSTLDSTLLPAVPHNRQKNMSFASGNCSLHAVCPLFLQMCHSQRIKSSCMIAWHIGYLRNLCRNLLSVHTDTVSTSFFRCDVL